MWITALLLSFSQDKEGPKMSCLNMYNTEQQPAGGATGLCHSSMARISFSSDFLDTQQAVKHDYREAPVSSDFEFSVTSNTTLTLSSAHHTHHADEIFFKGVLLPLKDDCAGPLRKMTLRDELLAGDDDELEFGHDVLPQLPKISGRWKERLGLRRPQVFVSKKEDDKIFDGFLSGVAEEKKRDAYLDKETIFGKKTTIKEACELAVETGGKQK